MPAEKELEVYRAHVAVNADGVPSFNLLQNFGGAEHTILFYAFDLFILAGTDLRLRPLEQRRALLRELIPALGDPVRQSETFDVSTAELLAIIRQHGLKGIGAKRRNSTYRTGDRSGDWVKLRVNRGQDFVIGGYVPSSNTFDSIVVGYYEGRDLVSLARGCTAAPRTFVLSRYFRRCLVRENLPALRRSRKRSTWRGARDRSRAPGTTQL